MPTYIGSCHCGEVRFEVDAEIDHVRSCDCLAGVELSALPVKRIHGSRLQLP
jgi:hypothetical protein